MDLKWVLAALAALVGAALFLTVKPGLEVQDTVVIAQGGANRLALIDPASGKIETIDASAVIHGVGILQNGAKAYASSLGSDEISVIDLNQKQVVAQVNIGGKSHHIEMSPDGRWAYITVGSTNEVAIVDTRTDTLVTSIPVGEGPTYTVFSPNSKRAYVSSRKANIVSVIDTEHMLVVQEIQVESPDHLALSPDGLTLYVASRDADNVNVIDTDANEVTATIAVGKGPHGIAVAKRQGRLLVFVGNRGGTTLSIIDTTTLKVIDEVDLKVSPEHITPSPDNKYLYIGSVPDESLLVFSVEKNKVLKRIDVKGEIHQIVTMDKSLP